MDHRRLLDEAISGREGVEGVGAVSVPALTRADVKRQGVVNKATAALRAACALVRTARVSILGRRRTKLTQPSTNRWYGEELLPAVQRRRVETTIAIEAIGETSLEPEEDCDAGCGDAADASEGEAAAGAADASEVKIYHSPLAPRAIWSHSGLELFTSDGRPWVPVPTHGRDGTVDAQLLHELRHARRMGFDGRAAPPTRQAAIDAWNRTRAQLGWCPPERQEVNAPWARSVRHPAGRLENGVPQHVFTDGLVGRGQLVPRAPQRRHVDPPGRWRPRRAGDARLQRERGRRRCQPPHPVRAGGVHCLAARGWWQPRCGHGRRSRAHPDQRRSERRARQRRLGHGPQQRGLRRQRQHTVPHNRGPWGSALSSKLRPQPTVPQRAASRPSFGTMAGPNSTGPRAVGPHGEAEDSNDLCELEIERRLNIERNAALLQRLGLGDAHAATQVPVKRQIGSNRKRWFAPYRHVNGRRRAVQGLVEADAKIMGAAAEVLRMHAPAEYEAMWRPARAAPVIAPAMIYPSPPAAGAWRPQPRVGCCLRRYGGDGRVVVWPHRHSHLGDFSKACHRGRRAMVLAAAAGSQSN